jgi:GTPase KRas protein
MRDQYIRAGEGFLIVYSITQRSSFDSIKNLKKKIFQVKEEKVQTEKTKNEKQRRNNFQQKCFFFFFFLKESPVVIVGNKCDLDADREVLTLEGKEMAKTFHTSGRSAPFYESSAKERINVEGKKRK